MRMHLGKRVFCACAAFVFSSAAFFAVDGPAGSAVEPGHGTAANLARIVAADRAITRVRSVLFGAWKGDKPLLTLAAGDSYTGIPATTDMHIRPGVVQTEALTTILVQLEHDRPGLLETPISRWFPTLPRANYVTLRMLANQRSGYGDYEKATSFNKTFDADPFQTFTADQLIAIGMKQPMPFRPGKGFQYSHTNAVLLGAALQHITGESIASLIAERFANTLHLTQTIIPRSSDPGEPAQHVSYTGRGVFEDSTYFNPSWALYSGTIVSTIHDVAVMQRAIGSGALVSKAGFAEIVAPTNASAPRQSKDLYFGLGVVVANTWILNHAQVAGSDVVFGYLPSRDLTIVASTAFGFETVPISQGYSLKFFRDAAEYLAPERPIPSRYH